GSFANAIANYSNTDLGLAFAQGNLTTQLTGDVVQYTITSADNTESISVSIDLLSASLEAELAVNDIQYILDNDILKLAFFPTQ
ncbi:MAG: hypothetical protein F6K35_49410, partial [Okeania sp. SIO2H7]|nr:hypothetical protein [Okeania sp. SIO2H7]